MISLQPETTKPATPPSSAKKTAPARSRSRRCNECDGCTREDCGNCEMCKDRPKFGGENKKKQACLMRLCLMRAGEKATRTIFDDLIGDVPSPVVMGRVGKGVSFRLAADKRGD